MSEQPLRTPDREFFVNHPVADGIRTATLQGLDAYAQMLRGDESAISRVLDANRDLQQMGVTAGMHTIETGDPRGADKQRQMKQNPVMAAEWVGGQLLKLLQREEAFDIPDPSLIAEHDELLGEGDGFVMTSTQTAAPAVVEYAMRLDFVGRSQRLLDAEAGL